MPDDDERLGPTSSARTAPSTAAPGAAAPGARLPVRRTAGVDEGRGGQGVRRPAADRRRRPTDARRPAALAGEHPDVREVVRVGPAISAEQAAEIVRQAALAPVEGDRKVLVLHEFHLLNAVGAGAC